MIINTIIFNRGVSKSFIDILEKKMNFLYTVIMAEGTAQQSILKALGLDEIKKDVVYLLSQENEKEIIKDILKEKYHFEEKPVGIYFASPTEEKMEDYEMENVVIYIIVNRGMSDDVVEVATANGAGGATILHGRGSGIEKKKLFFDIKIEPEKDIILIVSSKDKKEQIINSVKEKIDLEKEGNGVIFTMPVIDTLGFRKISKK